MTALERILDRGLSDTVGSVRRMRRRVEAIVRRSRDYPLSEILARVKRELARTEPDLARAIQGGLLAAWVSAAQKPARELPHEEHPDEVSPGKPVIPPTPPRPPFGPLSLAPPGEEERPVRWPAVEAAARDLLSRRAVTPDAFATLAADVQHTAFTLAGATSADTVDAVKEAVTHDVLAGGTLRDFHNTLQTTLDAAGITDAEAETIYRTQTGLARASGLRKVLDHPLIADEFPYWRFWPTHDGRTRPDHLAMETAGIDGTNVFRCDDPKAMRCFPPCGYNCRCLGQPCTIEDAAAAGVREARQWLTTGEPPVQPAFVDSVPVVLPKGWPVPDGSVKPIV